MGYPENMGQDSPEYEPPKPNPHREFLVRRNRENIQKVLSGELTQQQLAEMQADREVELENRADHDGLTGLLNYQGFMDALTEDLGIIHQYDLPAYLGFLDGDKLKDINDNLGKPTGNKVIQTYAKVLTQITTRRSHLASLIGRWGGDEFMILVIGAGRDEAIEIFEEIRQDVPKSIKETLNMPDLESTVSIGVVKVGRSDNAATLTQSANDNLDRAKEARNKVVFEPYSPGK